MGETDNSLARPDWLPLFAAWLVALVSTLVVLFVGEVMGQAPCNLCWYQRAFMFPLAIILGVACLRLSTEVWFYALPVTLVGGLIAGFHTLLYVGVIPAQITPCGQGPSCASADMTIFGNVPLPALSLLAFGTIAFLLVVARRRTHA